MIEPPAASTLGGLKREVAGPRPLHLAVYCHAVHKNAKGGFAWQQVVRRLCKAGQWDCMQCGCLHAKALTAGLLGWQAADLGSMHTSGLGVCHHALIACRSELPESDWQLFCKLQASAVHITQDSACLQSRGGPRLAGAEVAGGHHGALLAPRAAAHGAGEGGACHGLCCGGVSCDAGVAPAGHNNTSGIDQQSRGSQSLVTVWTPLHRLSPKTGDTLNSGRGSSGSAQHLDVDICKLVG